MVICDREFAAVPPELSVIIPIYNEEENIFPLYDKVTASLIRLGRPWELILVDDGSTDRTPANLEALSKMDARVVVVELRRNFGQTAAMAAGFEAAQGGALITMDADLQNDPDDIPALLEAYDRGYDVASGWRRDRKDRFLDRTLPSRLANSLISWSTGVRLHDYGCTLKVYRSEVVKELNLYGEMHRFLPALMFHKGARVTEVPVRHHARLHGRSKYGIGRVLKVILDLTTVTFLGSYATKPIYVFGSFGVCLLLCGLGVTAAMVYWKYAKGVSMILTPFPTLAAMLVILGAQSMMMGLLAELQVRTYHESQQKPTYVVRRTLRQGQLS